MPDLTALTPKDEMTLRLALQDALQRQRDILDAMGDTYHWTQARTRCMTKITRYENLLRQSFGGIP